MSPPQGSRSDGPLDGGSPKYRVTKHDGTPVDPKARYLVLRLDNKDGRSPEWAAARAYLDALRESDPDLWRHLVSFFRPTRPDGEAPWGTGSR